MHEIVGHVATRDLIALDGMGELNNTQNTRLIQHLDSTTSKRVQYPFDIFSNNKTQKKILSAHGFPEERILIFRLCL